MKKTIMKATFYLIILSFIGKALSFIVRIMLARTLTLEAMSYYTLTTPTMIFVITLAQMGIPTALSKVIAQQDNHKSSVASAILLSLINNFIITFLFIIIIPYLSTYILKQPAVEPILYTIIPLIPMVTISGLLKGYLLGIQHHLSATGSQLFEELSRIIFLFIIFTLKQPSDPKMMAAIAMISITVGEVSASIFMLTRLHLNKHQAQQIPQLFRHLKREPFDELLMVSLPMTGSRLIGSLTYFFEPIIMVVGISSIQSQWMMQAYGQLNGYVLPIITMPSFITITLSNFLLPSFTYHYSRGHVKQAKKLFYIIITCCFTVGMVSASICYQFGSNLLQLFYHNQHGALVLKQLAWPFALYSLQPPLSMMLHALSRSHRAMMDTFIGSLVRILSIALLTKYLLTDTLPFALCAGMLITTLLHCINIMISFRRSSL